MHTLENNQRKTTIAACTAASASSCLELRVCWPAREPRTRKSPKVLPRVLTLAFSQKRGARDFRSIFWFWSDPPCCKCRLASTLHVASWIRWGLMRCLPRWSGTDNTNRDNRNYKMTQIFGRIFWMDFLDGFFGRIFWTDFWTFFWTDFWTDESDGNPDDELGTKFL